MFEHQRRYFLIFFLLTVLNFKISVAGPECCPPNTYLKSSEKMCSDNKTTINLYCEHGALLLDPSEDENDRFSLGSNGLLSFLDGIERTADQFCVGKIQRNGTQISENSVALICFDDVKSEKVVISSIHKVLMLISTLFLLITLYIYAILPNLRDIQGKCVIAFICCLTAGYITLLVTQTFIDVSDMNCVVRAAIIYYFMSATFVWNTIVTFIIWRDIRNASHKVKESSQAIIYFACGFGLPLIMVVLAFILEHLPFGNHIRPQFGEVRCWFKGKTESWSYFYGPISVLLVLNILMFLQSIWTLWRGYKTTTTNSKLKQLRYKCLMYLKLFLLMGIPWIFEVISYAASSHKPSEYIWFITDCLNCAQGVFIFLILVAFRQKVRLGLLKENVLNINWPKKWAKEKILESSTASLADEFELEKSQMTVESRK